MKETITYSLKCLLLYTKSITAAYLVDTLIRTMKVLFAVLFSLIAVASAGSIHYDVRDAPFLFLKFVRDYNRQYKDTKDVIEHQTAFVTNLLLLNEANAKNPHATYDINNFSDFTDEEMRHINAIMSKYKQKYL